MPNAVTGQVGTSRHLSAYSTNQDLASIAVNRAAATTLFFLPYQ
jgi:hypothetical protein